MPCTFSSRPQYYFKIVVTPDLPFTSQDSKLARPMRQRARADVVPCVRVCGVCVVVTRPGRPRVVRPAALASTKARRTAGLAAALVFGLTCLGAAALFGNGHEVVASSKERQGHT